MHRKRSIKSKHTSGTVDTHITQSIRLSRLDYDLFTWRGVRRILKACSLHRCLSVHDRGAYACGLALHIPCAALTVSAMFTKRSNKKHKTWDDGVLIVQGLLLGRHTADSNHDVRCGDMEM